MKIVSFFLLSIALFLVFSIPDSWVDSMRAKVAYPAKKNPEENRVKESTLVLENQLLQEKIGALYEWLLFDNRIDEQTQKIRELAKREESEGILYWKEFFQRRSEEEKKLLERQMQALLSKVIFREPSSWNRFLWVNVGEKENETLGRLIVAKNSPVLCGPYLVGVVDYVDKTKSRIRLITDSQMTLSVRAVRGSSQDRDLMYLVEALIERIKAQKEDPLYKEAVLFYESLQKKEETGRDFYLLKGELRGSFDVGSMQKKPVLRGSGFNYQFEDEEFCAEFENLNLKKGDLLVTTGLDGVFPAGLKVAFISKVFPKKEGDLSYEIEALPCFSSMNDLSFLHIIPPLDPHF